MLLTCAVGDGNLHPLPHLGGPRLLFRCRSASSKILFWAYAGPRFTGGGSLLSSDGLRVAFFHMFWAYGTPPVRPRPLPFFRMDFLGAGLVAAVVVAASSAVILVGGEGDGSREDEEGDENGEV